MNDDFLTQFRKPPHPELASTLYQKISQSSRARPKAFPIRVAAAFVTALVLAIALLLSDPRAQALAQGLLLFFSPAHSDTFAVPAVAGTASEAATSAFSITGLEACQGAVASSSDHCAIRSAEASLGIDILESPSVPEGFVFVSASVDPTQDLVVLTYSRDGSELTITQRLATSADSVQETAWSSVPIESVERVQIHDVDGEYVRGMFVVKSRNGTEAVWEPEAPVQRVRWYQGELWVEIQLSGLVGDDESIGKLWLLALADSLR